ncbi:E3 ubiquitin-protein ligase RZFP34-like [Nicotiana tabacum]|uniref:E3 ubiquitin-protein ligase RZFP34-like n=1 Tax=Nicotiana tabacum TaxID=4097 RepID=A0AC58U4I1_TOBAC
MLKCRTGGNNNFFHCNRCDCCYSNMMKESHICVERAMHHNCPVCFETSAKFEEKRNLEGCVDTYGRNVSKQDGLDSLQ